MIGGDFGGATGFPGDYQQSYFFGDFARGWIRRALLNEAGTSVQTVQDFATGRLRPDLTLLLDVPVDVGLERTRRRAEWNRFEDTEEVAFFETVRNAYLRFADEEPHRFRVVNGSGSVEDADAAIRDIVEPLLP